METMTVSVQTAVLEMRDAQRRMSEIVLDHAARQTPEFDAFAKMVAGLVWDAVNGQAA